MSALPRPHLLWVLTRKTGLRYVFIHPGFDILRYGVSSLHYLRLTTIKPLLTGIHSLFSLLEPSLHLESDTFFELSFLLDIYV